jgi:hypothetical protein
MVLNRSVKARHDKMVGLVETMRITADGERIVTLGSGGDELRRVGR